MDRDARDRIVRRVGKGASALLLMALLLAAAGCHRYEREAPPPPAIPTTDADGQPLDEAGQAAARAEADRVRAAAERAAADLLVQNDFIHALPHYLRLARDYPDTPAFAAMVTILRSKIDAYCRLPGSAGDEVCQ